MDIGARAYMVNANGDDISGFGFARAKWGFPKIRGTFLGGPSIKDHSILGSILGSTSFGKLPKEAQGPLGQSGVAGS